MATALALVWDLIAHDNASGTFKRVGAEAEAAAGKTEAMSKKVAAASKAIVLVGVGVAAIGVKMAVSMQESNARIQGNAQLTAKAARGIGDAFLATAGQSTFSGKAMADAFGPVAGVIQTLSGHVLTAADSLKVMKVATDLAEASGQPLASTTADLASVMQAFHLRLTGAAGAANILFNTSRLTNVGLDTLATTVVKLHGKLGIASPSLEQTSALMVDLAQHGISGSRGLLIVNSAMTTLLGGSKSTSAELKTLGVHVYDASGRFVGMQSVLGQLTPKLADMSDKQRHAAESALFGKTAASALNLTILAGAKGFDTARAAVGRHNAVTAAAAANAGTLAGKAKTLGAEFADTATTLGQDLLPILTTVFGFVGKHVHVFEVLAGVILGVSVAIKAVALAQAVLAVNPVWLAIGAVVAVAALAIHRFGGASHDAIKPTEEWTNAILADSDALGANTAALIANKLGKNGLYDAGLKLGLSQRMVYLAALGNTTAINQVTLALARGKHGSNDMKVASILLASGLGQTAQALKVNQRAADNQTLATGHLTGAQRLAAQAGAAHLVVLGANTRQAGRLATAYYHLPLSRRTKVTLDDYASSKLAVIKRAEDALYNKNILIGVVTQATTITNKRAAGSARAAGGPVTAGVSYLVGEYRPEMFTPDVNGSIDPRPRLGGSRSGDVNIEININGVTDKHGAAMEIRQQLLGLKRTLRADLGLA
jgi:TP901 family phage tail tape measure protein